MTDTKTSALINDQPAQIDLLDFRSYSQALKKMIVHTGTSTPLTLGIFGRWGTGKTTLMQMLEKDLKEEGVITIRFNAWRYDKEDELWAALLQSVINGMKDELRPIQRFKFESSLLLHRTEWRNLPISFLNYFFRVLLVAIPLILAALLSQRLNSEPVEAIVKVGGGALSAILGGLIIVKPLVEAVRQNVSFDFDSLWQKSDYQKHIAFLDNFHEHFRDVVKSLPPTGEKKLAVFIDDLDRCSREGILQVLDAIKLFVDVPGCVYIMGLDLDITQRAVSEKYKDDQLAASQYIGKIIQLPFHLPPLTRNEMRAYVERIATDLPDRRCREVFVTGLDVNPREVKRTINIFTLLWNLALMREGIADLITPVRLAKVVVIQHGYPDLHKTLREEPYLLSELEDYYRRQKATKSNDVSGLPDQLRPFAGNELLKSMLLLQEANEFENDSNFGGLSFEKLAVYFTLTRQAEIVSSSSEVTTKPYRRLYVCYSMKDSLIVDQVTKYYQVLGDDAFRDVLTLRSGGRWNEQLERLIEQADVFQLFWSHAAAQSPFVEQEWKYALSLNRPNFIRPVIWEKPPPPPPPELAAIHFSSIAVDLDDPKTKRSTRLE